MAIDREATLKNAEKFLRVGRLDAAIAEYARVVEEHPRDWNTANALGDLYMRAGQSHRAVPLYSRVADHLLGEGFYPKAAALFKKILKITPDDEEAQLRLAEISARQGLMADARAYYSTIEKRRRASGNSGGADEIIVRLGSLDPEDLDARLASARAAERRGQLLEAAEQYRQLADAFLEQGRMGDAERALEDGVRCNPELRATNLLPLARMEFRRGGLDQARALLIDLVAAGPPERTSVVELGWELAATQPEAAVCCVETVADRFLADGEFEDAARLLQECAERIRGHVPVLLKLVEVCVDGGLEDLAFDAQARLADAYLEGGNAAGARVIAEDLVARDPHNAVHLDRFRRALEVLNVEDPDGVIRELTSSRSEAETRPPTPVGTRPVATEPSTVEAPASEAADRTAGYSAVAPVAEVPRQPEAPAVSTAEIDLTQLLGELQGEAPPPESAPQPARDLEDVFAGIRAEGPGDQDDAVNGDHLDLARTYLEMGMPQEAIGSLEMAARSPRYRFVASVMLGEICRDEGDLRAAIEWLERGAEAPAPDPARARELLYDLADLLETVGETARSLAVFLELGAEAPGYRDVQERVARLSRIETEG